MQNRVSSSEVGVESLESVTNERQTHFGGFLYNALAALLDSLCLQHGGVIGLVDLVGREVGGINVGS